MRERIRQRERGFLSYSAIQFDVALRLCNRLLAVDGYLAYLQTTRPRWSVHLRVQNDMLIKKMNL